MRCGRVDIDVSVREEAPHSVYCLLKLGNCARFQTVENMGDLLSTSSQAGCICGDGEMLWDEACEARITFERDDHARGCS